MKHHLPKDEIERLLQKHWKDIALFAYESYLENGKGAVRLEKSDCDNGAGETELTLMYAVFDYPAGTPDQKAAKLLELYDPDLELIVQYMDSDQKVFTLKVSSGSEKASPERIFLLKRMLHVE